MKRLTAVLAVFLAITTAACGQAMKQPDIKLNPHPKMRYEITLTIEDAPGPFDTVEGSVDYQVENDQCVPLQPVSGAKLVPRKHLPLALTRIGDKVYKGEFYADLLTDEDYFGLGVCQWSLVGAGASLQIGNVIFSPDLLAADIWAKKATTRYFDNSVYFSKDAKSKQDDHPFVDSGRASGTDSGAPKNTFSTTLISQEKFQ